MTTEEMFHEGIRHKITRYMHEDPMVFDADPEGRCFVHVRFEFETVADAKAFMPKLHKLVRPTLRQIRRALRHG